MLLRSLRFFIVTHAVFSSVGGEMLAGDSVVAKWDNKERAGPKDDRQVTLYVLCLIQMGRPSHLNHILTHHTRKLLVY